MPSVRFAQEVAGLFPFERWQWNLPNLAEQYQQNKPCPHILLKNLLDDEIALEMAREFPRPVTDDWTQYKHANENKSGMTRRELFPPLLRAVTEELNSYEFVEWISRLTGIPDLIADPMLEGGGLHQSGRGGYLNVHTDFSKHHFHPNWHRRVNLILYLNEDWDENWGGSLELWEKSPEGKMTRYVAKYPPLLNHAIIFTTTDNSLHGFPDPLTCPAGRSRKSLALYYYTAEANPHFASHSTEYFARPQDGWTKSTMIWLDKKAVDLYSRAKAHFGFSDEVASRVLGWWSRRR